MITSREYCNDCKKALVACTCRFIEHVDNKTPITILRHSSEKGKEKATVDLISRSLSNCKVLDGELFESLDVLRPDFVNILVYPSNNSKVLQIENIQNSKDIHFIFLDGTWKKAFKIYQINHFLHELKTIELELNSESPYSDIRKQKKDGLSTYEAVYEALSLIEPKIRDSNLEKNFHLFLNHLKSYRN